MHDESAGGQAVYDRALAYWTDPGNFDHYTRVGAPVPSQVRVEKPVQDRMSFYKRMVFHGILPSPTAARTTWY
jgi:hypothetical protein